MTNSDSSFLCIFKTAIAGIAEDNECIMSLFPPQVRPLVVVREKNSSGNSNSPYPGTRGYLYWEAIKYDLRKCRGMFWICLTKRANFTSFRLAAPSGVGRRKKSLPYANSPYLKDLWKPYSVAVGFDLQKCRVCSGSGAIWAQSTREYQRTNLRLGSIWQIFTLTHFHPPHAHRRQFTWQSIS